MFIIKPCRTLLYVKLEMPICPTTVQNQGLLFLLLPKVKPGVLVGLVGLQQGQKIEGGRLTLPLGFKDATPYLAFVRQLSETGGCFKERDTPSFPS